MIQDSDQANEEMMNKLETLKMYSQLNEIPIRLHKRIKRHIENKKDQKKFTQSEKFLNMIPKSIRDQVVEKTHSQVFA